MDTLVEEFPKDLEIFVITNGRSTFDLVMRALEAQTIKRKITVLRDMKWVDALNKCVELCESEYFLRVDDDMFLHPYTVAYYLSRKHKVKRKRGGVFVCRLWEDWSHKPVNGVRMYSHRAAKKLGFVPSRLGKVDKVFKRNLERIKLRQIKDPSLVGIHALAPIDDQTRYRDLWRDQNASLSKSEFAKTFDNRIHPYTRSIKKQYRLIKRLHGLNASPRTGFFNFCQNYVPT